MKRTFFFLIVAVLAFQLSARPLTIKIATTTPENTPWGQGLNKIKGEWSKISQGQIEVKIYHGGTHGDTSGIRQKMDIGTLDAGVFDSMGLHLISPEALAISIPNMIQTDQELDYILSMIDTHLREKIEAKGYIVLAWSKAGWIRFFSKYPVVLPDDLRKQKLSVNPNEMELQQAFKTLGFNVVPQSFTGVIQALSSGLVEAAYTSPLLIASQWTAFSKLTPFMTAIPVCPFIGAVLIKKSTWAKIDDDLKPKLVESLKYVAIGIDIDVLKKESAAVIDMQKNGLTVPPIGKEEKVKWDEDFKKSLDRGLGSIFPTDTFDLISKGLEDFRKAKK